jgi:hypothetical protein
MGVGGGWGVRQILKGGKTMAGGGGGGGVPSCLPHSHTHTHAIIVTSMFAFFICGRGSIVLVQLPTNLKLVIYRQRPSRYFYHKVLCLGLRVGLQVSSRVLGHISLDETVLTLKLYVSCFMPKVPG